MNNETPTPRTDAFFEEPEVKQGRAAQFARTLERELAERTRERDEAMERAAVAESQVENADMNLEQIRMAVKANAKTHIEALTTQLEAVTRKKDEVKASYESRLQSLVDAWNDCNSERGQLVKERDAATSALAEMTKQKERLAQIVVEYKTNCGCPLCRRHGAERDQLRAKLADAEQELHKTRREINFKDNTLLIAAEQLDAAEAKLAGAREAILETMNDICRFDSSAFFWQDKEVPLQTPSPNWVVVHAKLRAALETAQSGKEDSHD